MSDIASLGIKVTTEGVKDASSDLDKLATSGDKAAKSTDSLNKSFNQAGGIDKPAKAAAQAFNQQTAALAKLAGQIDPTIAKLDKLDALQTQLGKFKKSGMISAEDFTALNTTLDASRAKIGGATDAVHKFSLNNAMARRELGYLAKDLATGQYGRFQQSALTLANASGAMSLAFSGIGLAVGGIVAALGAFAVAAFKAAEQEDAFNKALIATGNYAGVTSASLQDMARNMAVGATSQRDAAKALTEVAASGRFTAAQIGIVGQAAVDMARLTGQSTAETVKQFERLKGAPVEAILKLNESEHFLTSATYARIKALQDSGKEDEAATVAMKARGDALHDRAKDVEDSANWMVRSAHAVSEAWGRAWDNVSNKLSSPQGDEKLGQLQRTANAYADQIQKIKDAQKSGSIPVTSQDYANRQIAILQQQFAAASKAYHDEEAKQEADRKKTTKQSAITQALDAQTASDAEVKEFATNAQKRNAEKLAAQGRANVRYAQAMAAGNKALAEKILSDEVKIQAGIDAKYKDPKTPRVKAVPDFRAQDMREMQAEIAAEGKLMDQRLRSQAAVIAYRASLKDMLATRQATIDLQVASLGMGDREIAQQQALIAIDEDYNRQKASLERQQRNSTSEIDKSGFAQQLADLKQYHDARVKIETEGFARSASARGSWEIGAQRAYANILDSAADVAGQTDSLFTNAFDSMGDALANFATTGKLDFKGLVTSILSDLAKMEVRIAASKILQSIVGAYMGGSSGTYYDGSGTATGLGNNGYGYGGGNTGGYGMMTQNATGGVYTSPSLSQYSGQIVTQPTAFAFAKGAGIMGEAGPEAILPLSRGADGKLGVKAGGSSGDVSISQTFVIDSNGSTSDNTSGTNDDNMRQFAGKMKSIAQQAILEEQRAGGSLWRMRQGA